MISLICEVLKKDTNELICRTDTDSQPFFLGAYLWHMEVPRLGVELEQQLPAYTIATATWDPSYICDLHPSSQQCQSEAGDYTHIFMDTSQIHFR